jgi:hypothetical protein
MASLKYKGMILLEIKPWSQCWMQGYRHLYDFRHRGKEATT